MGLNSLLGLRLLGEKQNVKNRPSVDRVVRGGRREKRSHNES